MRRQRLRPVEPQRLAQMGEGARHRDLVVAAPLGEVDDADRAVGLEQANDRGGQRLGRAGVEQLLCKHIPLALSSEEHTSELQSLMRITYAVFCLKKTKPKHV